MKKPKEKYFVLYMDSDNENQMDQYETKKKAEKAIQFLIVQEDVSVCDISVIKGYYLDFVHGETTIIDK